MFNLDLTAQQLMKRFFLISIIVLISCVSYSQNKKFIYYFDKDFNSTTKSKSVFTGIGTVENGLVKVTTTSNKNNQLVEIGHYIDSSLKVSHGLFDYYYVNGNKSVEQRYEQGEKNGVFRKWDNEGRLVDSTIYDQGNKISIATFKYNRIGMLTQHDLNDIKNDKEQKIF